MVANYSVAIARKTVGEVSGEAKLRVRSCSCSVVGRIRIGYAERRSVKRWLRGHCVVYDRHRCFVAEGLFCLPPFF